MKKISASLMLVVLISMVSSCNTSPNVSSTEINKRLELLESENKKLKEELAKVQESKVPKPSPKADTKVTPPTIFKGTQPPSIKPKAPPTKPVDLSAPIKLISAQIKENIIGIPEVYVKVKNISKKTIDAYDVEIHCFNSYGEPVDSLGDNIVRGTSQELLKPGQTKGEDTYWQLSFQDTTSDIKVLTHT